MRAAAAGVLRGAALSWRRRCTRSSGQSTPGGAKILDQAGSSLEIDRRACLQARDLDHPRRPWKIERERRPKVTERLVRCSGPMIASDSTVDLDEVHPAHQWPLRTQFLDPRLSGFFPVQPGKHRPGVQTYAHLGSRVRSSSRRAAIPVPENRPPSCCGDRRATSTISRSRNSKSNNAYGARPRCQVQGLERRSPVFWLRRGRDEARTPTPPGSASNTARAALWESRRLPFCLTGS